MYFAQSGTNAALSVAQGFFTNIAPAFRSRVPTVSPGRVRHRERAEEARARGIAHGLEVRVLVRLQDRADRDARGEVHVAPLGHDAHEDLGVRAHEIAEPVGDPGKAVRPLLELQEELDRAEDASREDDVLRRDRPRLPEERKERAARPRRDLEAAARRAAAPT